MKETIKKIPIVGNISRRIYRKLFSRAKPFTNSEDYWIRRYNSGGNSGAGSYNKLAEFKAEIINEFVKNNNISSIIEYGCGDGNQLKYSEYPSYIGFDISPKAVELCQGIFKHDNNKKFRLASEYNGEKAQLTLSLDVIYHLTENDIYHSYMKKIFNSSEQFVIIYSSDFDEEQNNHEKRRKFTKWVEANEPHWKLVQHIPNKFPYKGDNEEGSLADFYIYAKKQNKFTVNDE